MKIFPAIDLYEGKAVRLYKGNYDEMTVYAENPVDVALDFKACGAEFMHIVDLEGAKNGNTPNLEVIKRIADATDAFIEVGGGVRSLETISKYVDAGIDRVIIGTCAVTDRDFLVEALKRYGDKIAVGVDVKDGKVAIKGWVEKSEIDAFDFCADMEALGVKTVICTDISKDGAMQGTNREMYKTLSERYNMQIIASGGVSDMDDVRELSALGIYGAIIGKAYYVKAISLREAIEVGKRNGD